MLNVLLLLGLLLGQNEPATSDEVLWIVRAVGGEVGVMGEHRHLAGMWVVHTILNRVESEWFPNNIESVVRQGYAGSHMVDMPHAWAFEALTSALTQRIEEGDPTSGGLFLIGGLDLTGCMDWSSHRGSLKRDGWDFSVHMFAMFPFDNSCPPLPAHKRRR